ncbi:MAG: hypothetical protein HC922_11230 [Leptolyngbyaceae cyanobacterium SM2_3_12]|nr:hypothetical protein [Leptolyngbyaceae cyanobacterium SM2_3_12]
MLVCDGIGGHEQGNVASQTAIKLLLEELQPLSQQTQLTPTLVAQQLKQAIVLANNAIAPATMRNSVRPELAWALL